MRHAYLPNLYLALFKRYISMCLSNSEATRGHKKDPAGDAVGRPAGW